MTPYTVQRNYRRKEEKKKLEIGKEIIIENPININRQESPKFYQDTNKDRILTFCNDEDNQKSKTSRVKKESGNYKELEKRLVEIEKDIGYFSTFIYIIH